MIRLAAFLILFPFNSIAKDYLFDEMVKSWSTEKEEFIAELPEETFDESYDSWDNLYLDPYADLEIIYTDNTVCD